MIQNVDLKKNNTSNLILYVAPKRGSTAKKPGENPATDWVKDSEIFPSNFKAYRNDRKSDGGGVFILVEKSLIAVEKPSFVTKCEIIWAKIHLKGRRELFIGCFYMPHRNADDLQQLDKSLQEINKTKSRHVILCGDFNSPGIDWETYTVRPNAEQPDLHQKLIDLAIDHNLTQVNRFPTYPTSGNILDLCFTTNTSLIKETAVVPGISDHDVVITDSYIKPQYEIYKRKTVFQFSKANWVGLRNKCIEISTSTANDYTGDVNMQIMWNKFKSSLHAAIKEFIPSKTVKNRNNVPWMSPRLKSMIKKKTRLHKKASASKDWTKYKTFQKEVKKAFQKAESDYVNASIEKRSL